MGGAFDVESSASAMGKLVARVRTLALTLGAPGLFLVAFLDSSVLPLPGITDVLLIVLVTRRSELMLLYVAATTAGSLGGCLVMHFIGKKGGDALVKRRFATAKIERAMASLQRHGVMAVLIPSLLPPPAPFKIFLLLAGAVGIPLTRFAAAIAIARSARYLALGILAVRYGSRAQVYVRENGPTVSLAVVAVLAVGFAVYLQWRKANARKSR
jgi:membrane protein YqaA with SNARE-associated domain